MSTLFVNVLKQALKTFDCRNQSAFVVNFGLLKQLTEQLTYRDINLNAAEVFSDTSFNHPDKAPCTFIHVFENSDVSMSVFVMRPGYTMPLHDHPMMHGILKCFYGKLLINSYTQQLLPDEPIVYNEAANRVPVIADGSKIVQPNSECAILTPIERNYHEITAVEGVAAFFDILSPPYDANMPIFGRRKCKFYRKNLPHKQNDGGDAACPSSNDDDVIWLERIPCPHTYCCDTIEANDNVYECCASICEAMSATSS